MDKKDAIVDLCPAKARKKAKLPFLIHTFFIIAYIDTKVNIISQIPSLQKNISPKDAFGEIKHYSSNSLSQLSTHASDGIRQSPRGERLTEPTLTPSGRQERLNCCEKNRL